MFLKKRHSILFFSGSQKIPQPQKNAHHNDERFACISRLVFLECNGDKATNG
ncbi:MAG: hypothetical protein IKH45_06700 [Neisseriaceae bacterium]|nr:hypothetical protein [Neisseriaceae bacterium]